MKITKTNAMRILEKEKTPYTPLDYATDDGLLDGVSVAKKTGQNPAIVFKTLVLQSPKSGIFVFCIPVEMELDLKRAAKTAGAKSLAMLPVAKIMPLTGYVKGGCSPLGMKKPYPTFLHASCMRHPEIIVSGGQVGVQIKISPANLLRVVNGTVFETP